MYSRKRTIVILSVILILIYPFFIFHCDVMTTRPRDRLRNYMDSIRVVNTHEHQRIPQEFEDYQINFYHLLYYSYLRSDMVSAGAPQLSVDLINRGDLDTLWSLSGPCLDFSSNTSYYSHFLKGFKILYDLNEPYFSIDNIRSLSQQIGHNYQNRESWYDQAFHKAGFEIMFVDQYWNQLNVDLNPKYFALVFNINQLVTAAAESYHLSREDAPFERNPYKMAEEEGYAIKSLDDYLAYADRLFEKFIDHNAVCLKNSMAYNRTLKYDEVPYERAKALFKRRSLNESEKKEVQDFLFHWIIQKAVEHDLPIQIHTGYLAGNGNTLENSRPTKLNNLFLKYRKAKFILFHGGYPWTGEYGAMGKMFPNVYLDLVWLPQISRQAAVQAIDELLDLVPYNKFFWGGDCAFIEESVGSLDFGKDVVAEVLARRVERGLMSEDKARDVALKIFRENAIRVFKLDLN